MSGFLFVPQPNLRLSRLMWVALNVLQGRWSVRTAFPRRSVGTRIFA